MEECVLKEYRTHPLVGKINVWGDYVIVKLDELTGDIQKLDDGLYIPNMTKKHGHRIYKGLVIGVGKRNGPYIVKPGDRVIVNKYGGINISIGVEGFLKLKEYDILGLE